MSVVSLSLMSACLACVIPFCPYFNLSYVQNNHVVFVPPDRASCEAPNFCPVDAQKSQYSAEVPKLNAYR